MKKTGVIFVLSLLLSGVLFPAGIYAEADDSIIPGDSTETFVIKIEDPVLEQAIRKELNVPDRPLQYHDLQQLTSLYPQSEDKIKSLKGLEWASNLTSLMVSGQQISDVTPLQNLYRLRFLALDGNQITNICPVAGLDQIDRLVIFNNQIKDIGCLSRLTGLTDLLADHNQIEDIQALSGMNLSWINLDHNPISDITPLTEMDSLKHLYVDTKPLNEPSLALLHRLDQSGVMVNRLEKDEARVSGISVMLGERRILFEEAPVVENGNTLVPFRPLFEKLGFTVHWDSATQTVTGEKNGVKLALKVGETQALKDAKPYTLEVAPKIVNGSLMVPIRFVGEASAYDVTWDSRSKTIYIAQPRDLKSDDGRAQIRVSGKWRSQVSSTPGLQIYAVNDSSTLMTSSDPKAYLDGIASLDEYEQAVLKNLSDKGYNDYSKPEKITVNGLPARQFAYSASNSRMSAKILATVIEGKYNYFRIALMAEEDQFQAMEPEFQRMIQSFQELKTISELNREKFGGLSPTDRLLDAARYYRGLGFFDQEKSLTAPQFDDQFMQFYKQFTGKEWNPFDGKLGYGDFADLYVLGEDKSRVWLEDTEADVGEGNDVYVETLKRWSQISRGAFMPTQITEEWGAGEGPVTVSFMLNGTKKTIHPFYQNDFIDIGIIHELNALIADTGYQFVAVTIDQTVFVTVLTAKEKETIEKERFIPFEF